MKVKITSQESNPLLKRKEVAFDVEHGEIGGTPPRFEVRKRLTSLLNTDLELVYVKRLETKTGTKVSVGEASVYDAIEQAQLVEPKHIIDRNASPEKLEEEGE